MRKQLILVTIVSFLLIGCTTLDNSNTVQNEPPIATFDISKDGQTININNSSLDPDSFESE